MLYWASGNQLVRRPLSGGPPQYTAPPGCNLRYISHVDYQNNAIFFTCPNLDSVYRFDLTTLQEALIYDGSGPHDPVGDVTSFGNYVYWVAGGGSLASRHVNGLGPVTAVSFPNGPVNVIAMTVVHPDLQP